MSKIEVLEKVDLFLKEYESFKNRLTFGGDPEFMGIIDNHIVVAYNNMRFEFCSSPPPIGVDMDRRILEIRPQQAKNAYELLLNFYNLIKNYKVLSVNYSREPLLEIFDAITANANRYSLGGHIHIGGADEEMVAFLSQNYNEIGRKLDKVLYKTMYKLSTNKRKRSRYLLRDDNRIRSKKYGIEYRTPPSIIWLNPLLFYYTLETIKLVIFKFYIYRRNRLLYTKIQKDIKEMIQKNTKKIKEISKSKKREKLTNKKNGLLDYKKEIDMIYFI
ncbi:MAG: hypothetical protein NZM44_05115 [Candidatus Calescibacterium sp.]|nr:hypothetical protein [Candidatus Calescibacterium sp.]